MTEHTDISSQSDIPRASYPVDLRVVMPIHNPGPFLERAVTSVLEGLDAVGGATEMVIVNDGSTDGSGQWLERHVSADARVSIVSHITARGPSNAMNAGIAHGAPARFVAVAEHDDVSLLGRFEEQLLFLTEHPDYGAVSGEGRYLGPDERVFGRVSVGPRSETEFQEALASREPILIPHPAAMFRMAALDVAGLYDPEFDGAHDLELFNRLVYRGWKVRTLARTHVHYRVHAGATSFAAMGSQRMITRYIAARNVLMASDEPVPAYQDWARAARGNRRDRLRWARKDRGALLFRRAGLAWLTKQPLKAVLYGTAATAFHPRWVLRKVLGQTPWSRSPT